MIHEEICAYEVAKLAKEKGFPQHITDETYIVDNYGEDDYNIGDRLPIPLVPDYMDDVAAPTQSLLQRWLREEKHCNIEIAACPAPISIWIFVWSVSYGTDAYYSHRCNYDTYEQALEDALKYALENLV